MAYTAPSNQVLANMLANLDEDHLSEDVKGTIYFALDAFDANAIDTGSMTREQYIEFESKYWPSDTNKMPSNQVLANMLANLDEELPFEFRLSWKKWFTRKS